MIAYRPFTRDDEDQIIDLLSVAMYGERFPDLRGYWRWKNYDCPFGESFGLVTVDEGMVVGLRVFMHWHLRAGDRVYRAGRAVDIVTHPDWRRRGFFEHMTAALVETLAADGFDFTFNMPNELSLPGYLKMGWTEVGRLPMRVNARRPVRLLEVAARHSGLGRAANFTQECDNSSVLALLRDPAVRGLVEREEGPEPTAGPPGLRTVITPAYLDWHYGLNRWYPYCAAFEERRGSAALVIGRPRVRGGLNDLLITEVIATAGSGGRRLAARAARGLARQTRADYVGVSALRGPLGLRNGYLPVGSKGIRITVCPLQPSLPVDPRSYEGWSAAIGDLELF